MRLRILRLCLDEALTNRELAERLARKPRDDGAPGPHAYAVHEDSGRLPRDRRTG